MPVTFSGTCLGGAGLLGMRSWGCKVVREECASIGGEVKEKHKHAFFDILKTIKQKSFKTYVW